MLFLSFFWLSLSLLASNCCLHPQAAGGGEKLAVCLSICSPQFNSNRIREHLFLVSTAQKHKFTMFGNTKYLMWCRGIWSLDWPSLGAIPYPSQRLHPSHQLTLRNWKNGFPRDSWGLFSCVCVFFVCVCMFCFLLFVLVWGFFLPEEGKVT